ncbi:AAA family ATPase [Tepidiforma sp.]|uniref:ATP-binding protein n=1 Tax=Tepidiforma sp. TaxID=2682230 RepID=UPI002ADDFB01|nr:AAA family ATPase [Tepidiforma sp.]
MQPPNHPACETLTFPFSAILGQDELKLGLLLNVIDPQIGGLLALGDRGTAKSTTVRALAQALAHAGIPVPVVTLPLGASDDRVLGGLDLEAALLRGEKKFAPGLLAEADGGILYIDEVNLLDDYLVDLLLDVAASGVNHVERDGLAITHPARFILVGSGNPEEGDLRPQLEDRFGLAVNVKTITDVAARREVVARRIAFTDDPVAFCARYQEADAALAHSVAEARERVASVEVPEAVLDRIVEIVVASGATGHRGEIVTARAARARAALAGRAAAALEDLVAVAPMALRHRIPREPFDSAETIDTRIAQTIDAVTGIVR